MIGLLEDDDARQVFSRVRDLQALGDPGGVIDNVTQRMAYGLPPGSPLLAERAQAMVAVGAWHSAVDLDLSVIDDEYVTAIEQQDERVLTVQSFTLRAHTPADGVARRLIDALSSARLMHEDHLRGHVDGAFEQAVSWLSRDEPDAALRVLIEAAAARYLDPPYLLWLGAPPSREVVAQTITTAATWEPQYRMHYLDFLAEIGAHLDQYVEPEGPLLPVDVHVATALWQARRDRDASDPSPYPLPDDVVALIVGGAYGDDAAYEMAARDDLEGRNKDAPGLGPSLVRQVAELYRVEPDSGPAADPRVAATALVELTFADILRIERLPSALNAARVCLENASRVPIDLALQIQWNLAMLEDMPRPAPFRPSLHWPFNAIKDAVMKLFASRGPEVVDATLRSDPARWVIRPPMWADYSAVYALSRGGALSIDDALALTEWAAAAGGQMLRFVTRESITEDFVARLHERCPEAVRVNIWEVADALARLGRLAAWRERLIALLPRPEEPDLTSTA
jgi:hypothetical protein